MNIEFLKKKLEEIDNLKKDNELCLKYGEITTPKKIREEMINMIDEKYKNKNVKIYECCAGKGVFIIELILLYMELLKEEIIDNEERYKYIVENIIYFNDINNDNIIFINKIINPDDKYKINGLCCDTLKKEIDKKFDLIISNPPYNLYNNKNSGNAIWYKFVDVCLNNYLNNKGNLIFVTPNGWRKITNKKCKYDYLFNLMTQQNQLIELKMYDRNDGVKNFKCHTKYDIYNILKKPIYKNTKIIDYKKKEYEINLLNKEFIPSMNIDTIYKIYNSNAPKIEIIHSSIDFKKCKKNKDEEYKYKCIHLLSTKKDIDYRYNNKYIENLLQKKIIICKSSIYKYLIDNKGELFTTRHCILLKLKDEEYNKELIKGITHKNFPKFLKSLINTSYNIEIFLFEILPIDFHKYLDEIE